MYYKQIILGIVLGLLVLSGCSSNEATPNISTDPVEIEKTYMEEIVEKYGDTYQHLKWLDEEGKTLNLNGSLYDITDEKAEYGDLWMFAVDISKEDVELTFDYIVQLEVGLTKENGYSSSVGGIDDKSILSGSTTFADLVLVSRKTLGTTTDPVLSKFNKYYIQDSKKEDYYWVVSPDSFNSRETGLGISNENKDIINFEDKNWLVRNYMIDFYTRIVAIEKDGGKVKFLFDDELSKTK